MTEHNKPIVSFSGQAPASGENISEGAGEGAAGDKASSVSGGDFVSKTEFEQRLSEFQTETQRRTDKAVTSIREKVNGINKTFNQMVETGVLTDDQKKDLEVKRNQAIADVVEKHEDPDLNLPGANDKNPATLPVKPGSKSGEAESAAKVTDPIVAAATKIMDEVGARIYEDDPEAETLKGSRDTSEYLANAKIAATQKLARLNRDPASLGMRGGQSETSIMDIPSSAEWDEVSKTI